MMFARENLIAGLYDQLVCPGIEALAVVVGAGGRLLQYRVGGDHFAGNEIPADAEMLQRALGLCAPQFIGRDLDLSQAVGFNAHVGHGGAS